MGRNAERHKKVGLKISYYRKVKGLTQEQLADRLNMHLTTIGAIEAPNMGKSLSLDTLFNIADVLDIPPHLLLQFEDER